MNIKNWNLIKLRLEWGIRSLALMLGSLLSVSCLLLCYRLVFQEYKYKHMMMSVKKINDLFDIIFFISFVLILPILVSIFILVATRKFKELNKLIEENKKL
jgi:hypothetical protein